MNSSNVKIGASLLVGDMNIMVPFYRDVLGLNARWDGGDFAEFETASGYLSFFMYSRKEFVKAIGESYTAPSGINQTCEIALRLHT